MAETEDPVAALSAKQLPVRAAGARDLALSGTAEHLEQLLRVAIHDVSPGVRLGCAAAAADILTRYRLDPGPVDAGTREAHLRLVASVDPGLNPGLFQVSGALGTPGGWRRIELGLRDPRFDVRTGAVVGLWRFCVSAAVNGDAAVEAAVVANLDDPRVPIETKAEVAKVCANLGFVSALTPVARLAASVGKGVAAVAAEAQRRLEAPPPRDGFWVDLGVDAGAVTAVPLVRETLATVGDQRVGLRAERITGPRRALWIKRPGVAELGWALQLDRDTLYPATSDEMLAFGDRLLAANAWGSLAAIDPILPPGAASLRLRGAVQLHRGDLDSALAELLAAAELKKVPVDTWWLLGDVLTRMGRVADARPYLERYLAKAPKRGAFVERARALLES